VVKSKSNRISNHRLTYLLTYLLTTTTTFSFCLFVPLEGGILDWAVFLKDFTKSFCNFLIRRPCVFMTMTPDFRFLFISFILFGRLMQVRPDPPQSSNRERSRIAETVTWWLKCWTSTRRTWVLGPSLTRRSHWQRLQGHLTVV